MTIERKSFKRALSLILTAVLLLSLFPLNAFNMHVAAEDGLIRSADPSTMNDWTDYFYQNANDFNTANAGGIWTDKSVLTSADELKAMGITGISDPSERGFVSVLSAIGSNMTITGQSKVPTDTILVLDTSGSMGDGWGSEYNDVAAELVDAANISIRALLSANENNRIGVVFYANDNAVGLPLGRYTTTDNQGRFFNYSTEDGEQIILNDNVTIEGSNRKPSRVTRDVSGGTFIQGGLDLGMDQFLSVTDTTVTAGSSTIKRKPIMILLTDGAPTRATTSFTNVASYTRNFGDGNNSNAAIGFATQLTAAYAKQQMETHYDTDGLFYTLGVGIDNISSNTMRYVADYLLNPNATTDNTQARNMRQYWSTYNSTVTGRQMTVSSNGYSFIITKANATLEQYFVDKHFNTANYGTNLQAALLEAFADIVADIEQQSAYYPTLIQDGEAQLSGYISFVDKLGRYMVVTDIHGIVLDNTLYSGSHMAKSFIDGALGTADAPTALGDNLIWSIKERLGIDADTARSLVNSAYNAGQLYYNSETDFSNYFGWYSDDNNQFLGFYAEGTTVPAGAMYTNRSYLFLGEYNQVTGTYDEQTMYATVRVRELISTNEQEINLAFPASLVPNVTYNVTLNEDGTVETLSTNAMEISPIRLIYGSELDSRINKWTAGEIVDDSYINYLSDGGNSYTTNEDGSINFYNNKWSFDRLEGYGTLNPYSYYRPSYENNRHYYQEDVVLYVADGNGHMLYEGAKPAEGDGNTYFYGATIYHKTGADSYAQETLFEQIPSDMLYAAEQNGDGEWCIPAKYIRRGYANYSALKSTNATATSPYYASPYQDYSVDHAQAGMENHYSIVGTTLGNNGKIILSTETGIRISKQVEGSVDPGDKQFSFTVTNTALKSITCEAFRLDAAGNGTDTTVSFNSEGVATVSLQAGESIYIGDMSKGQRVIVKELADVDYIVKSLTVDGQADEDFIAEVILNAFDMPEALFTNGARGKGSMTVTKRITHPYGTGYTIPANKEFPITLTFTLNGAPLANYALADGYVTDANGQITSFKLTHNSSQSISGIPIGTVVQVAENAPAGFTPLYSENIDTANDGMISISNIPATVSIVNNYIPNPPSVSGNNITVAGIKRFDQEGHARLWTAGDSFTFLLQEYTGDWVTMEHENAIQTITITADDGFEGTANDYPFDFTNVFDSMEYSTPGTYYYRIIEQSGSIPGVNYDITTHRFAVTVSDDEMDGSLEITAVTTTDVNVSVTGNYDVTATFINDYNPNDAVANFEIHKIAVNDSESQNATLDGFQFLLAQVNDFSEAVDWSHATNMGTTTSTGVIKFPITLEQPGIYKYKVREFIPTQIPAGWTYTEIVQDIIVEVTDTYGHAGLVAKAYPASAADPSGASSTVIIAFENVYDPSSAEVQIDFISKNLIGRDAVAGEFSFTIYDEDNKTVYTTGTNTTAAEGQSASVTFEKQLVFDKVGEYHFSVYENVTAVPAVTFDKEIYHFTVVVNDNGQGALVAVITVDDSYGDNTITFTNSYDAQDLPYALTGTKALSGKVLTANAFGFYIQACDENGIATGDATLVYNNENGNITFPQITYTDAGIYHYLIWENIPSGDTMGISYDETRYIATVTITDNAQTGKLEATVAYQKQAAGESDWSDTTDGITFGNSYAAASTSASFTGSKTVIGMDLVENAYTFELYKSDAAGNPLGLLDTQRNGAPDGNNVATFTFNSQTFTHAGTYYFIAKEQIPGNGQKGIRYDGTVYYITVTVTDNGRGQLIADTRILTSLNTPADTLEFVNEYAPVEGTSVTFFGNKTLETGDGTDVDFTDFTFSFELYNSDQSFTVSGTPETTDSAPDGKYSFTTNYKPEDLGKTFYYVIVEKDYGVGGMTYSTEEYHITVTVLDTVKDGVIETAVTITDKAGNPVDSDRIDFINNYAITEVAKFDISGTKILTGRDIKLNEFRFDLYAQGSDAAISSAFCGTDGKFSFLDISISRAGVHSFIVKEDATSNIPGITYDPTQYLITVTVADNKDGTLKVTDIRYERIEATGNIEVDAPEFQNEYSASASAPLSLTASKVLSGRDMAAGEFTFVIYDEDNQVVYTTGTNQAASAGFAADITFQKDFVFTQKGEYHFSVYEQETAVPGVTADENKFFFTITVRDDGHGILKAVLTVDGRTDGDNTVSFSNSYKADDVSKTLTGLKVLEGQTLTPNAFSFYIQPCDENGTPIPGAQASLVYNGDNGVITYPEFTYTEAGTYQYLAWENIPDGELYGVTYDETKYIATVKVTDDIDTGKLVTDVTYQIQLPGETTWTNTDSGIIFGNRYDASSTFVILEGTKTVTGMDLAANDYSFELYQSDETWTTATLLDTKNNGAADEYNTAVFSFNKESYDAEGVFYYIVKEKIPEVKKNGVTYDEAVYHITVTVNDNDMGLLVPETVITLSDGTPADAIAFVNKYAPVEGTSVTVLGEKSLETGDGTDVDFTDFTFSFELHETDETFALSEAPELADSAADGKYSFTRDYAPDALDKTFYYVIVEKDYGVGGMTYSQAEYHITVKVLDTVKDGVLETVVTITDKDGNPVDSDKINFVNNYAITEVAKVDISGTKELSGRDIQAEEFKFDLYTTDALMEIGTEPMRSVYAGTDGKFEITEIALNTAGTHYFILKEDATIAKPGVTYDETAYLITVIVVDNKDGTLRVTDTQYAKIGDAGNTAVDELVFNNKYQPSATFPLHLSGSKVLNGRALIDGEFAFVMQATDNQFQPLDSAAPMRAVNNENGFFTFDAQTYYYTGTYYYVIYEDSTLDISRVTFDDAMYYVTVRVTDDIQRGRLAANYSIKTAPDADSNVDAIVFTNTFTPRPDDITVDLDITKTVVNLGSATMTAEGFEFALELIGLTEKITVTSDADGKAKFTLTFTEEDIGNTYSFKLTEINTGAAHVSYSTVEYAIDITITLDENNKLVAELAQDAVDVESVAVEFINEYDYTPVPPDGPSTGDSTNIHLWLALLLLSAGAILTTSLTGKKKTEEI